MIKARLAFSALCLILLTGASAPREALQYQRTLTREAHFAWGLDAPIPTMAAQITQESGWDPNICSAYACGLTQFTPSTAKWISGVYPKQLGDDNVFNPQWAMRALVLYDKNLYDSTADVTVPCDHWAFTLSAYNGGLGFLHRDQKICVGIDGCDSTLWFGNVELHTSRSASAAKENRGYPRRILFTYQPMFSSWGEMVLCSQKS